MTNINLNIYKIFCEVATSKSYYEASGKINQSVPNISKQISNLEKQLNTKLFNRDNNGVTLTEDGKRLYDMVSKGMFFLDEGEKILKEKNNLENATITIGCPSHITIYYLMDCIEKAKKEYPGLNIKLVSAADGKTMLEMMNKNEIDFIIIDVVPTHKEDVVVDKIKSINNTFVSKKPLKINDLKELENLKCILNFNNTNTTKRLKEVLDKYDVELKDTMECDVTEVRVDAAKRELGIGYVIKEAVKKELESKELYEVEIPIELPCIDINLMYIKDKISKVEKSFIKKYLKK